MKQFVLDSMRKQGRLLALELQSRAGEMSGTELYAEDGYIPEFNAARAVKNMIDRPIGFVCKSSAGRVVKLLQPYDSNIFTAEPEDLPAQWGFVWSKDPAKALPFVAISTSPYMKDDCCTDEDATFTSLIDNNVWSPGDYPAGWKKVEGGESDV